MLSNSQTQSHTTPEVNKQSRALTGSVTKLLDNFGFIDDSVFFQLSVVKGGDVQVGDKVYCECSYSEHLPFKWNATKVHLVQQQSGGSSGRSSSASTTQQQSSVATTYLQHRLQQQSRDDNNGQQQQHNYYSSQPPLSQQFDFSKAQQAVVAAQQLQQYYGRNNNEHNSNSFNQLQYTSTPGSAFVSSTLPFTQQIQPNLLSSQTQRQPINTPQNSYKTSSRWSESRDRSSDERFTGNRNRDNERSRFNKNEKNTSSVGGRDEFGRDLRRERDRERERLEKERRVVSKRSESPQTRVQRRRYEPVNIPKLAILKNPLNVYDIKQRYSANLHIPSDLKEVIINSQFSLNINDIPKPITFRVIQDSKENNKKKESKKSEKDVKNEAKDEKDIKTEAKDEKDIKSEAKDEKDVKNETKDEKDMKNEAKDDNNDNERQIEDNKTTTSSPEQLIPLKQIHKYGVKVLIISLPSINDIYDRIFGSDFDAISTGSKAYFLHFNKLLAFLVSRNANDGFSLIGGKFNPQLDGYLSDTEEPNLIATAIRVVGEQTGMNLTKCGKWKLIATFIYNRDNSVDPINPSLECTRVYMPDIWCAFDNIYDELNKTSIIMNDLIENNNELNENNINNDLINSNEVFTNDVTIDKNQSISDKNVSSDGIQTTDHSLPEDCSAITSCSSKNDSAMDLSVVLEESSVCPTTTTTTCTSSEAIDLTSETPVVPFVDSTSVVPVEEVNKDHNSSSNTSELPSLIQKPEEQSIDDKQQTKSAQKSGSHELHELLARINDMKVTELRHELEKRGSKIKTNLKKADLIVKLREIISQLLEDNDVVSDDVKNDWWAQRILSKDNSNEKEDENDEKKEETSLQMKDNEIVGNENNEEKTNLCIEEDKNDSQMSVKEEKENNTIDIEMQEINENKEEEEKNKKKDDEEIDYDQQMQTNDTQDSQKSSENGTTKRKNDSNESSERESKKPKNGQQEESQDNIIPKKVLDGCVYVKGGENLTVITLHEALNHQRYDQFEMSIASEIIRESLIHHFSHYILSTLVHNHQNPIVKEEKTPKEDLVKIPLQVNYVHLSFAYFDSSHCGHILGEDLAKLLNNANFTLSRRAFNLLVNNEEKVIYRDLNQPKELLEIKKTNYKNNNNTSDELNKNNVRIIEKNGTVYDIQQLIEQSENDEKLKIRMNEELAQNKDKIEQFTEYINELENKQKKMTIATEKLNDEICSLKRDREIIKNKFDAIRKVAEVSVQSFNEVLKSEEK